MKGPENRFIASVHRLLKGKIHFEKMHNPYRGGTADVWYSGSSGDAWIEYKWLNSVPKRGVVKPKLEPLQRKWLQERYAEGRTVLIVVGCPAGGILFANPDMWEGGHTASQITILPKKELANEILLLVGTTSEKINAKGSKRSKQHRADNDVGVQNSSSGIPAVRVAKISTKEKT